MAGFIPATQSPSVGAVNKSPQLRASNADEPFRSLPLAAGSGPAIVAIEADLAMLYGVSVPYAFAAAGNPRSRISASTVTSRPRKARNASPASTVLPRLMIVS